MSLGSLLAEGPYQLSRTSSAGAERLVDPQDLRNLALLAGAAGEVRPAFGARADDVRETASRTTVEGSDDKSAMRARIHHDAQAAMPVP